ncbi:UNVERIFIED_ORG: type IV secretory pathway VirB2 component (pilin) [Rhizobium esperanzae]|nr:TrbC/VirB2 family protein [Rhizobium phaseoli]ARM14573.1 type IV secretion system TrbC/VirB2 domain-containing protein [Rhizobium phaseoli Brasil 5]
MISKTQLRPMAASALMAVAIVACLVEPAFAQAAGVETVLQNIVTMLTGNIARLLAVIAVIIICIAWILGFQRDAETAKFGRFTTACNFADVDHQKIAEACGCPAVRIFDPADLPKNLERGLSGEGPLLIEVMTDPGAHPPLSLFAAMDQAA